MTIEIRPATQEEMLAMGGVAAYVYAGAFGDEPDNLIANSNRPEWTLCAFDGGDMVASFATLPFTMRVAGRAIPMGGISAVGTLPEYRRRGILRQLISRALQDMKEREQPLTGLWASQAAIYQRYQFAMTSPLRSYRVDTTDIAFHDGDMGSCTVARASLAEGMGLIKQLYIAFVGDRIGYLHRAAPNWQNNVLRSDDREGPVHLAICRREDGTPSGYLIYTVRSGKTGHRTREQEMRVREIVWLDLDGYRSLWRFIALHDMVGAVRFENLPMDDPAPELFLEPRLLHVQDAEGHWSRVVDVEGALAGRGYLTEGRMTIGITPDALTPWNEGVYSLEASPDGASVTRSTEAPDVQLSVKALASLYFGFRSARELAAWGMLAGEPAAVTRANELFATPHRPHTPDHY